MIHRIVLCWLLLMVMVGVQGQPDTSAYRNKDDKIGVGAMVVPGVMMAYGFAALKWTALKTFDGHVRKVIWENNPHALFRLDNYLQYGPGLAVYGLNAAGVHGRHNFRDRTIIYLVANGIMGAAVLSLKKAINAPRPDHSGNDGFPSGHTALAFTGAEFMAQEFKDVSPWYGVAGYAMAAGTGFLRVYNDKHWFSEVVSGAGIGILAGKVSYWLFPVIERKLGLRKKMEYKW